MKKNIKIIGCKICPYLDFINILNFEDDSKRENHNEMVIFYSKHVVSKIRQVFIANK